MRHPAILWLQLFLGLELCCSWCFGLTSQACPVQGVGLDPASKTYLAPAVFQGKLLSTSKHGAAVLRATFRVQKVLKMEDSSKVLLKEKNDVIVEFTLNGTHSRARRRLGGGRMPPCKGVMIQEQDLEVQQRYIVFVAVRRSSNFIAVAIPEPFARRKAVSKILCPKCAKAPTVRGLADERAVLKKKLRLKCKLSGNPPPRIAWYKNGNKIKPNERLKIRSKRTETVSIGGTTPIIMIGVVLDMIGPFWKYIKGAKGQGAKRISRLVIRRVNKQDGGEYECRATNVIGNASAVAKVTVIEKRPSSTATSATTSESTLWPLQGLPCPVATYCLNGGTCILYDSVGEYVCECAEGYGGRRCENKAISTLSIDAPRAPHDLDATTRMLQLYWGK